MGLLGRWEGADWAAVGGVGAFSDLSVIWDLAAWDNGSGESLYVGGNFQSVGPLQGFADNIVRWDGSNWFTVNGPSSGGANGDVRSLTVWDDGSDSALYAGGSFSTLGGVDTGGLGKRQGQTWSAVTPAGVSGVFSTGGTDDAAILALLGSDSPGLEGLFTGGSFYLADDQPSTGIAHWRCVEAGPQIFADGFESGDLLAWTNSVVGGP